MPEKTTAPYGAGDILLQAKNIGKTFTKKGTPLLQALADIDLAVIKRRVTGLVGADGSGKTTLIRIAAGLLTPSSGTMTLLGFDSVKDSLEIQSRVGYMPQKFGLYQDLSVQENLSLYADLQGVPQAGRQQRYDRLLAMTNLTPYTRRRAGALSGGMKQKLGLACALIKSPEMLLLDEPTAGVDPVSRRELWKIIDELVEKNGIGVLVSTAYLDEAKRCDHVVVLDQGKSLAAGSPEQFAAEMAGRVCLVVPQNGTTVRSMYRKLTSASGIIDATIRAGGVRTVCTEPGETALASVLDPASYQIRAARPNFEDAFMALIPREHQPCQPTRTKQDTRPAATEIKTSDVVSTRGLSKVFGDFIAVSDVNFSVGRGEIFGLLGPNGAGKSTTFRMLCGLLPASGGEIQVAGHDLRRAPARARACLGYMAQQFSLYGQLSVKDNLSFFGKVYGLSSRKLKQRMDWALHNFGLEQWHSTAAAALPGGYKQRLAMAAALIHEPQILFLDEPTSGVDPFARREFWLRINGFAEQGVTVVVTTHFMEEAEYCDRMLILSQGKTLAMGTPGEIRGLASSRDNPEPTMDDAFIALAEGNIAAEREEKESRLIIEGG